jgi:hypothetical protein
MHSARDDLSVQSDTNITLNLIARNGTLTPTAGHSGAWTVVQAIGAGRRQTSQSQETQNRGTQAIRVHLKLPMGRGFELPDPQARTTVRQFLVTQNRPTGHGIRSVR